MSEEITSSEQPPAGRSIGNVGILDIRQATEETLAGIRSIGNVGMIFYSPETAGWITRFTAGNVGSTVKAPAEARVLTGEETWSRTSLEGKEPLHLVVVGKLVLHPDVPRDALEQGLESLVVVGTVACPDHLAGVLRARAHEVMGKLTTYPWVEGGRFFTDKVTLDGAFLESLAEGSHLVALADVSAPEVLDDDLLRRKLSSLYIGGRLHCREENLAALRSRLHDRTPSPRTSAVPAGFEAVEGRLRLDMRTLESLPGRSLYCTGLVEVDAEVEAAALEQAIDSLQVTRLLIAPAHLEGALAARCDLLQTKAVFYEGELWHIEDKDELLASRFEWLEGKATLLVRGDLRIAADIDPRVLADRLHKVHNLDRIVSTPEQMGALQARMGMNEGQLKARAGGKPSGGKPAGEKPDSGNVGYLRL